MSYAEKMKAALKMNIDQVELHLAAGLKEFKIIVVGSEETETKDENGNYLKREERLFIIPDRKKAIRKAFSLCKKDDIVLLLGKAHENSIIYKDFVMPYDEISEAENALKEMGY